MHVLCAQRICGGRVNRAVIFFFLNAMHHLTTRKRSKQKPLDPRRRSKQKYGNGLCRKTAATTWHRARPFSPPPIMLSLQLERLPWRKHKREEAAGHPVDCGSHRQVWSNPIRTSNPSAPKKRTPGRAVRQLPVALPFAFFSLARQITTKTLDRSLGGTCERESERITGANPGERLCSLLL
jgi:hypothetical protein